MNNQIFSSIAMSGLLMMTSAAMQVNAQTAPEFYGQVSTGYYSLHGMTAADKTLSGLSDQPKNDNRWGLRGKKDLGGGLSVLWQLESNFSVRTGATGKDAGPTGVNTSGVLFDRVATVGFSSKDYGTLVLGRGPSIQENLNRDFDARANWNFAGLKVVGRYAGFHSGSGITRADNLIRYSSPEIAGFIIDTGYALGTSTDDTNTHDYLGGRYKNGDFEASYNHINARLAANAINDRVDFYAAKYQFDKLTINGGYVVTRNPSSASGGTFSTSAAAGKVAANTWFTGAVYKLSPAINFNAAWYQVEDKSASNGRNDLRMFAAGVNYVLSKRTELFADYAHAIRKAGATGAFTLYDKWKSDGSTTSDSAVNQSGISIGVTHRF